MRKDVEDEIVDEFLETIKNHTLTEKPQVNKKKKRALKTAAAIGGALIISLTITFQSDSTIKNHRAFSNQSFNVKKISNLTSSGINNAAGIRYVTANELPEYLEEIGSKTAGPDFPTGKL